MEILLKKNRFQNFRVLSPFRWGGYLTEVGQILTMSDSEGTGQVIRGRVEPDGFPEEAEFVALADLNLPGRDEAHRCKKFEKILLTKRQAIDLMLKRLVVPVSDDCWRPFGLKLQMGDDKGAAKLKEEALDKAKREDYMYEIGIHPAQKKRK